MRRHSGRLTPLGPGPREGEIACTAPTNVPTTPAMSGVAGLRSVNTDSPPASASSDNPAINSFMLRAYRAAPPVRTHAIALRAR